MKGHAEKGDFRLPFPLRRTVRRNSKESNAPGGDFLIPSERPLLQSIAATYSLGVLRFAFLKAGVIYLRPTRK